MGRPCGLKNLLSSSPSPMGSCGCQRADPAGTGSGEEEAALSGDSPAQPAGATAATGRAEPISLAHSLSKALKGRLGAEYLEEYVGPNTRRSILYQEYVKGISATGMQSNHGFDGQINACWLHKMSRIELEFIRSAGILVSVIHGRHDIIAQLYYAKKLAQKLHPYARMVELPGGHLVSHERTEEVNQALDELIKASEKNINPYDWTNLPMKNPGWTRRISCHITNSEGENRLYIVVDAWEKLRLLLLYFFSLFLFVFAYIGRGLRRLKPVRVTNSSS